MNVFRKRKQLRLKGYNYSQNGYYFVTICSESRGNIFGKIIEGTMEANSLGKSVAECLSQIPKHFPFVIVDEYVVMPNNVHAIIQINNINVGANNYSPLPKGKRPNGTALTYISSRASTLLSGTNALSLMYECGRFGTKISFRQMNQDAANVAKLFVQSKDNEMNLTTLKRFHAYVQTLKDSEIQPSAIIET